MKIIVDKIPDSSEKCLFHEKSFKIYEVSPGKFEKKKCNYCSLSYSKKKRECCLDVNKKCRYLSAVDKKG